MITKDNKKFARWLCLCDCQKSLPLNEQKLNLYVGAKLGKYINSCGCLRKENSIKATKKSNKKYNRYKLLEDFGIGYDCNNKEFYFDLEDYDKIKDYCWRMNDYGYIYAYDIKAEQRTYIFMHNLIMNNLEKKFIIDHINHNRNDNRKDNLRKCSQSKNSMNRKRQSNNTSGITGVRYRKENGIWIARIKIHGKEISLGTYTNKEDAIKARKEAEQKYFGEYSYDNSMKINMS